MKLHPAIKEAKRVFKRAGMDCHYVGTLSMHVVCREYNSRPLIIDLILSSHENKAKIDVCEFCNEHSLYAEAMKLHGFVFNYGE